MTLAEMLAAAFGGGGGAGPGAYAAQGTNSNWLMPGRLGPTPQTANGARPVARPSDIDAPTPTVPLPVPRPATGSAGGPPVPGVGSHLTTAQLVEEPPVQVAGMPVVPPEALGLRPEYMPQRAPQQPPQATLQPPGRSREGVPLHQPWFYPRRPMLAGTIIPGPEVGPMPRRIV
jgi:hypothetical protein